MEQKQVEKVVNIDKNKSHKHMGELKDIICSKCGKLNEYLWLASYNCPEVKKTGFTRTKIIPGRVPSRAIGCRCKTCGRKMRSEIEEDSPGTKIIDDGMTLIDDENKELMKDIREKIKIFNEGKLIRVEEEYAEVQIKILDSLYWGD